MKYLTLIWMEPNMKENSRDNFARYLNGTESFENLTPYVDEDRYPDEKTLMYIETFPVWGGYCKLMSCITHLWESMPTAMWETSAIYSKPLEEDFEAEVIALQYKFATGGWSGAEDVIYALKSNTLFWTQCWELSKRGGYFEFKVPNSLGAYNEELREKFTKEV